jgi:hypothetical protein
MGWSPYDFWKLWRVRRFFATELRRGETELHREVEEIAFETELTQKWDERRRSSAGAGAPDLASV